jgi:uncharacterized YigZ family protein
MEDTYTTVRVPGRAEIRVKGSRFIADVLPVGSREEALRELGRIRQEFHDATHHCYAFRLGLGGEETRYSDDGEPSGTAGRPLLAVVEGSGLTNTLLVVTRFFGGTKLGVGGLTHAYADAAKAAIGNCERVSRHRMVTLKVVFPHEQTGNVMHAISRHHAHIRDTAYDEEVHLLLDVRRSRAEDLQRELVDVTRGNIEVRIIEGDATVEGAAAGDVR